MRARGFVMYSYRRQVCRNYIEDAKMSDEKKKKITHLGGKPGQNRAEVTQEELDARTELNQFAKRMITEAGTRLAPDGFDHIGSATVHYYSKRGLAGPVYAHKCHLVVSDLEEAHAGLGLQSLRTDLMEAFGHKTRTRGNQE